MRLLEYYYYTITTTTYYYLLLLLQVSLVGLNATEVRLELTHMYDYLEDALLQGNSSHTGVVGPFQEVLVGAVLLLVVVVLVRLLGPIRSGSTSTGKMHY